MRLKNTLSGRLQQVIAFLKNRKTPVAETTASLLESKEVVVRYFSTLTKKELLFDFPEFLDRRYSKKGVVRAASKECSGLFGSPNMIYVRHQWSSLDKLAKTLVHECNHYLNRHEPSDTPHQNFIHEYRAHLAEEILSGKRLTRSVTKKVEEKVKRLYIAFQPDSHIEYPEGIYFRESARKGKLK